MKDRKAALARYQSQYVDLRFERGGLFELIRERFQPIEVLYPGCSAHLTPAFSFPHVVFVDQDPEALAFFSDRERVLDLIGRRRKYRRRPYFQFFHQDFTQPLPVYKPAFDLLLALYTGGVSKACSAYLKTGGLLLTNNHQGDALDAAQDDQLELIAVVRKRKGKYRFEARGPGDVTEIKSRSKNVKRYLRNTSDGTEYIENQVYYLFRRTRRRQ